MGIDIVVPAIEGFGVEDVLPVVRAEARDGARMLGILVGSGVFDSLEGRRGLRESALN